MPETRSPLRGINALDEARRVATMYRHSLRLTDPQECRRLDRRLEAARIFWPSAEAAPIDRDDWLTALEIANAYHVAPRNVREWANRGGYIRSVTRDGKLLFSVGDVDDYLQYRNARAMGLAKNLTFAQFRQRRAS